MGQKVALGYLVQGGCNMAQNLIHLKHWRKENTLVPRYPVVNSGPAVLY